MVCLFLCLDGSKSEIDARCMNGCARRQSMLPVGLGCACHDEQTAVCEVEPDGCAVGFVLKAKLSLCAKTHRGNGGVFTERGFIVAVPCHALAAVVV